jgi:hypothetical protein
MKSITINHKEYKLPESYSDISILKFQELIDLEEANLSDMDKHIHIVSIMLDMDILDVYQIPLKQIQEINTSLHFIQNSKNSDLLKTSIKVNNEPLYLIDVTSSNFSWTEWQDLNYYLKDGIYKNIHNIMSVLYRPSTGKKSILQRFGITKPELLPYNYEVSKSLSTLIQEQVSIEDVNGALVFFLTIGIKYILNTMGYSTKKLKKQMKTLNLSQQEKETIDKLLKIMKDGIGSQSLKDWQMGI